MAKSPGFTARIEQAYATLSPNARKVADYLQQHPADVVSRSVAEIAEVTGTSKATVSRFFRQLGYDAHQDVKQELRTLRETGVPVVVDSGSNDYVAQELRHLRQVLGAVSQADLDAWVSALAAARRITLVGFRNSYPVALHFRQQLLQIRSDVRLLPQPGQTLSEELQDVGSDELVVLIGFRRRPKLFGALVRQLAGKPVALLTDASGQIYKSQVTHFLRCPLNQASALDSYAAPMSLVAILCNALLAQDRDHAQQRINRIAEGYDALDELEGY